MKQINKLIEEWGGCLKVVNWIDSFYEAPFSGLVGLNHPKLIIYIHKDHDSPVPPIIHEMGHCFTHKEHPCEDETVFFGWEYLLAKRLGVVNEWISFHDDYGVDFNGDFCFFGTLTEDEKLLCINYYIDKGREVGIINKHDEPISVR